MAFDYLRDDPWDDSKFSKPVKGVKDWMQQAYEQEPWLLPSCRLDNRSELPETKGIYFAYQSKTVLYIGMTDRSFKSRWAGHHKVNELLAYQKAAKSAVRVAYWAIDDSSVIKTLEDYLISIWQPRFNKTSHIIQLPQQSNAVQKVVAPLPQVAKKAGSQYTDAQLATISKAMRKSRQEGAFIGAWLCFWIYSAIVGCGMWTAVSYQQSAQQQQQQEVYR